MVYCTPSSSDRPEFQSTMHTLISHVLQSSISIYYSASHHCLMRSWYLLSHHRTLQPMVAANLSYNSVSSSSSIFRSKRAWCRAWKFLPCVQNMAHDISHQNDWIKVIELGIRRNLVWQICRRRDAIFWRSVTFSSRCRRECNRSSENRVAKPTF